MKFLGFDGSSRFTMSPSSSYQTASSISSRIITPGSDFGSSSSSSEDDNHHNHNYHPHHHHNTQPIQQQPQPPNAPRSLS
ncbi:hypothetical protein DLAC_04510 [Tieghemostelium lacteum]|uniref:Uncharacterized protein n=1 Tax=Tieghemostelium lacteum TaxID=361077 RepID=A0A151ZJX6_TIELA|nr:hypothetical protein DLAC_04510 [Tieghemostelium lacteum]|eukprot:KYQ94215.1 hypothetical protein DLAC_04510 [Tieghemostelium lacteum]